MTMDKSCDITSLTPFHRSELLLGRDGMKALASKRVILFGVGGVGSWCAEGLIRSGVVHLTIVDSDVVSITNVNRQLMATMQTVGQVKVDAMKERLLAINPNADITAMQKVFCEETVGEFALDTYDYIIDAIDSLKDKALLIIKATQTKAIFFSSMGAALKLDSTRIKVAEFWKVNGDPLARAIRRKFKYKQIYPEKKFMCVYSDELLDNQEVDAVEIVENNSSKKQVNGSLVHITAIFGFTLAGLVVKDTLKG